MMRRSTRSIAAVGIGAAILASGGVTSDAHAKKKSTPKAIASKTIKKLTKKFQSTQYRQYAIVEREYDTEDGQIRSESVEHVQIDVSARKFLVDSYFRDPYEEEHTSIFDDGGNYYYKSLSDPSRSCWDNNGESSFDEESKHGLAEGILKKIYKVSSSSQKLVVRSKQGTAYAASESVTTYRFDKTYRVKSITQSTREYIGVGKKREMIKRASRTQKFGYASLGVESPADLENSC